MKRRSFLKHVAMMGAVLALMPFELLAAWEKKRFTSEGFRQAMVNNLGTSTVPVSDKISLTVPASAVSSASVPVEVSTTLKADEIYLFVEKNYTPLVYRMALSGAMLPYFNIRIKMRQSSPVHAVVKSGNNFYRATSQCDVSSEAC